MRNENVYQATFIKKLRDRYPGCVILKNDSSYMQGVPDLLFLFGTFWAIFEVKRTRPKSSADFEPNQEFYIEQFNEMSFAACVYPENEEEVLDALQRQLEIGRKTRSTKRQQR